MAEQAHGEEQRETGLCQAYGCQSRRKEFRPPSVCEVCGWPGMTAVSASPSSSENQWSVKHAHAGAIQPAF